jgi:selenocysteine-specific elongation factor
VKHVVIGTAGHIDHGKTKLTQALTGVDTDRLPEEKKREMSIELGFAPFQIGENIDASIVDVPGHERFVRNMVAGVSGIDIAVLVVAADDGVMPQTQEHLQILDLLELKRGLVVVTKADLVEPDWIEMVEEDVRALLKGTFLEDSPILRVSNPTGKGVEEVRDAILRLAQDVEPRDPEGIFRLPIDRVFAMTGFGTVITGTLVSGRVEVGSEVEILPKGARATLRGIQVHNQAVSEAVAGQRTALNLREIPKGDLERGFVITEPGLLESTRLIDARLKLLESAPRALRNRMRLRFHVGTSEIMARIHLIDQEALEPGGSTLVQFILEKETVALRGDKYIVRSYSPQVTIGGGAVLDPFPERFRGRQKSHGPLLIDLEKARGTEVLDVILRKKSPHLRTSLDLARSANLSLEAVEKSLSEMMAGKRVIRAKNKFLHQEVLGEWRAALEKGIDRYFEKNPYKMEVPSSALKNMLSKVVEPEGVDLIVAEMESSGKIQLSGESIRISARKIEMKETDKLLSSDLLALFQRNPFSPPSLEDVAVELRKRPEDLKDVLTALKQVGELVEVRKGLVFHKNAIEHARSVILEHFESQPTLTVSEFRQALGTSRKYALPLLDYFDVRGLTRRAGDKRVKGRVS